ncbi:hypothetical protein ACWCXX_36120 [Streptomyces sp. NPDC001732]
MSRSGADRSGAAGVGSSAVTGAMKASVTRCAGHSVRRGPVPVVAVDVVGRAALDGEEVQQHLQLHA